MKKILVVLALCACVLAPVSASMPVPVRTISRVQSVKATSAPSSAIDTSTATAIIVGIVDNGNGGVIAAPTDSKSNTYTAVSAISYSGSVSAVTLQLFSCDQPCTVGSGHTFSAGGWAWIALSYTGTATTSVLGPETGNGNTLSTTVSTGSITPPANDAVVVSCAAGFTDDVVSVDSGLSIWQNQAQSGGRSIACADIVQTTAGPVDAGWTLGASTLATGAAIVALKAPVTAPTINPAGLNNPVRGGGIRAR